MSAEGHFRSIKSGFRDVGYAAIVLQNTDAFGDEAFGGFLSRSLQHNPAKADVGTAWSL